MRGLLASLLLLPAVSINAEVITLDAEGLATGTSVSNAIDGVRILSYYDPLSLENSYAPVISEVVVRDCPDPDRCSQDKVFGGGPFSPASSTAWNHAGDAYLCEQGSRTACRETSSHVMNVFFDDPTNHFSFESYWLSDAPALFAFDSAGRLLFSCLQSSDCFHTVTPDGTEHISLLGFAREEADVARVMVGFNQGVGRIQELSVSVPEPSTWLLLGTGIVAVLAFRRRQAAAA